MGGLKKAKKTWLFLSYFVGSKVSCFVSSYCCFSLKIFLIYGKVRLRELGNVKKKLLTRRVGISHHQQKIAPALISDLTERGSIKVLEGGRLGK